MSRRTFQSLSQEIFAITSCRMRFVTCISLQMVSERKTFSTQDLWNEHLQKLLICSLFFGAKSHLDFTSVPFPKSK